MADDIISINQDDPMGTDTPVEEADQVVADQVVNHDAEVENGLENIAIGEPEARTTFLDYLKSPIVEILAMEGNENVTLSAHEALIKSSPFMAEKIAQFEAGAARRIDLTQENVHAVGSVIEYLYNGEYFPKRLYPHAKDSALELDNTNYDEPGAGLLKHARIYTLAAKLGLPLLKQMAHSKIHSTASCARGEIAYARYVYEHTDVEDYTIRRPVATFWAGRSHALRHEADDEFRKLCLEFPQFSFDVLTMVLDHREKKHGHNNTPGVSVGVSFAEVVGGAPESAKKRKRNV